MPSRKKQYRNQQRKKKLAKREKRLKQLTKKLETRGPSEKWLSERAAMLEHIMSLWTPEQVRAMETQAIIEKLADLGIRFDKQLFRLSLHKFYCPGKLADHLWRDETDQIYGVERDFPWMAAVVLWERLCPDVVNREMINDGIGEGGNLLDRNEAAAACDRWLNVWEDLKGRFLDGISSGDALQDRVSDFYDIQEWLISLDDELGNLGLKVPEFLRHRLAFCSEVVELLSDSDPEFLELMGRDIAETYFMLGDAPAGEAAFEILVEKHPRNPWVIYALWADLWTGQFRSNVPADFDKARALYQKAAELAPPTELEFLEERIQELESIARVRRD